MTASSTETLLIFLGLSTGLLALALGLSLFLFNRLRKRQRDHLAAIELTEKNSRRQKEMLEEALRGRDLALTALEEVRASLLDARQRADSATKAKTDFLANMSHEIRTPLNGILGMTNLLLDSPLDDDQSDYAKTIQRSGDSLLTLMNDILDFAKVEAGKLDFELVNFDLMNSCRELMKTFQYTVRKKGIELKIELPPDETLFVQGDPGRIRQILVNLIGNAVKFTEAGVVTLRVFREARDNGYKLRFEVADSGIGIEEKTLPHLFRAFSQGDASTTRKFGGTGLGLFICKRLVDAMKGEIGAVSKRGSGSTFWFEIFLLSGESRRLDPKSIAPRKLDGECRVLVAEDNEINRKIVMKMLEKLGLSALCVTNGAEVVEAMRRKTFDLVLMDCQMPVMDGYEATARIRSDRSVGNTKIPIIAMTANAMKGDREKCLAAGMSDYVSKPLNPEALATTLEKWITEVRKNSGGPENVATV